MLNGVRCVLQVGDLVDLALGTRRRKLGDFVAQPAHDLLDVGVTTGALDIAVDHHAFARVQDDRLTLWVPRSASGPDDREPGALGQHEKQAFALEGECAEDLGGVRRRIEGR